MDVADALEVTFEVTRAFESLEVRYLLGGSLAASLHGTPRSTNDADLLADLEIRHVHPLVSALGDRFYVAEERVLGAVQRRTSFNLIHLSTSLKVDVFVLGTEAFSRSEMERRRSFDLPGGLLQVASAEDLILQKLRWFRLGGGVSERQWSDLLGVLKVQRGKLDSDYLARWSAELGVKELLARAIDEAGLR